MVKYQKEFFFLHVYEKWFSRGFNISDLFTLTAHFHIRNVNARAHLEIRRVSYTLENDLDKDIEDIFGAFSETYRRQIRKADKENIKCFFKMDIQNFVKFYNQFAQRKNMPKATYRRLAALEDHLKMSFATYGDQILVAHTYLTDEKESIVRLFYSGSTRLEEGVDKKKLAIANKILHFKDMIYFKEQGYKTYDWGGYAEKTADKELLGINEFKEKFGGKKVACINYYSPGYFLFRGIGRLFGLLGKG